MHDWHRIKIQAMRKLQLDKKELRKASSKKNVKMTEGKSRKVSSVRVICCLTLAKRGRGTELWATSASCAVTGSNTTCDVGTRLLCTLPLPEPCAAVQAMGHPARSRAFSGCAAHLKTSEG